MSIKFIKTCLCVIESNWLKMSSFLLSNHLFNAAITIKSMRFCKLLNIVDFLMNQ